jgi:hypothetical protein
VDVACVVVDVETLASTGTFIVQSKANRKHKDKRKNLTNLPFIFGILLITSR